MMQQRFQGPDGTIYEEVPGQGYRVVSGPQAPAGPQAFTMGTPNPLRAAQEAANLTRTQQQIDQDNATAAAERNKAISDAAKAAADLTGEPRREAFKNAESLRSAYEKLPSVKNYGEAIVSYGAALRAKDDPAGDMNLIYAFAKIMDPNSVVREGEQASVSGGDTWYNQTVARLRKELGEGGTFSPEYRQNLKREMANRMGVLNESLLADRVRYKDLATSYGLDPVNIVGNHPGERYQKLESSFLGRPVQEADYRGNPIATGATRTESLPAANALINSAVRSGMSMEELNRSLLAMGAGEVKPEQYSAAVDYARKNPNYQGGYGDATREVPTTAFERLAGGPVGGAVLGASDAFLGGGLGEIVAGVNTAFGEGSYADNLQTAREGMNGVYSANPKSSLAGQIGGGITGALGLGKLASATGLTGAATNLLGRATPYAASVGYGGITGALTNDEDRLKGAAFGAVGGAAGYGAGEVGANLIGRGLRTDAGRRAAQIGVEGANRVRGLFGRDAVALPSPVAAPSLGEQAAAGAINRVGLDRIAAPLDEAASLGVPFALVDTNPALRELGGAAVRRSPAASEIAENTLGRRARGQIDRFEQALERDLGPVGNVPQISADMIADANRRAAPLYADAYRTPVPTTPELESLLATPFGRQATSRANTIAANERRAPQELGYALDGENNAVLNPFPSAEVARHMAARDRLNVAQDAYRAARGGQGGLPEARAAVESARAEERAARLAVERAPAPSQRASVPNFTTQSLDYAKRGMDDVIEQYRDPVTGRLTLDEAGRAQDGVRRQFLQEVDRLNPTYGAARGTYAGPAQARDAMLRGQDAVTGNPQVLEMVARDQSPEHLAQMQLGYRSGLMDQASRVRYSSNPFEAVMGSPVAEQRLAAVYPNNENVSRFLRTRDLERDAAQTSNAILGNSRTAQRQLSDQSFAQGEGLAQAADAGVNLLMGQAPVGAMIRTVTGQKAKDALTMGVGRRAERKAEQLAPLLFNDNPLAARASAEKVLSDAQAYWDYVSRTTPKRLGIFGRGAGATLAGQ